MGFFSSLVFAVLNVFKEDQESQITLEQVKEQEQRAINPAEREKINKIQNKARKTCECAEIVLPEQKINDGTPSNFCPKIGHECVYMQNSNRCWFGYDN
jgi:hypothetical protein